MKRHCAGLSPGSSRDGEVRIQRIVDFWNALRTSGTPGTTTWEVLEPLEQLVTEHLDHDPPDIGWAESLTARAALLIQGCSGL